MTLAVMPGVAQAFSVGPKLQRIRKALGVSASADILDIPKARLSRCTKGEEPIDEELARRISDVEYILERALRVMHEDEIGPWLIAPEPLLGDSMPLNTLVSRGVGPVAAALDGIFAGFLV